MGKFAKTQILGWKLGWKVKLKVTGAQPGIFLGGQVSKVPKLIYFLKRGWYSTNFYFKTMSKFSKNSLSTLISLALHSK